MKRTILSSTLVMAGLMAFGAMPNESAQNDLPQSEYSAAQVETDDEAGAENGYEGLDSDFTVDSQSDVIADNQRFWKGGNKLFSVGFTTGSFDKGRYNGGKLTSRWGVAFKAGRNIYVHPKPIANLVKFGIFIGAELNYMNFEKGHGSISSITGGNYYDDDDDYYDDDYYDDDYVSLGSHYLTAGLAIGPTATFMPFYWCSNPNVARIKVRPFFHVVPSYSALIVSDEDDAEVHGAFACLFSGGFELIWRKLSLGFEWKGGRARYKDFVSDLMDEVYNNDLWIGAGQQKQPRMGCKMFTFSIGIEF